MSGACDRKRYCSVYGIRGRVVFSLLSMDGMESRDDSVGIEERGLVKKTSFHGFGCDGDS